MDIPWVRIGIVTYNSGAFTQKCLDALAVQTEPNFKCVVWDNGSTDGALDDLRLPDARFTLDLSGENSGFSGGTNRALSWTEAPYVMSVNPDTELAPDCLEQLRAEAERAPDTAMLSPVLMSPDGTLDGAGDSLSIFAVAWRNGLGQAATLPDAPVEVFSPCGAAALYRRDAFEAAGGFDARYFCFLEDIDLGLRLRARGGRCVLVPKARGLHIGGHSTAALPGFAVRSSSRNALRLILHSAPALLVLPMLAAHLAAHFWFQFRNRGTDLARVRREGFAQGIRAIPLTLRDRFERKPYPIGASWRVARRLSWTISRINKRALVTWKYRG